MAVRSHSGPIGTRSARIDSSAARRRVGYIADLIGWLSLSFASGLEG